MDSEKITITICGDGGCGKSSITLRLVRSQWTSEYDPTIEDSYSITRKIDGQTFHLSLTDTAGQEEYRGMWGGSNLSSDAFLMVYDITSLASLEALEYFNELVDMEAENRQEKIVRAEQEYRKVKAKDHAHKGSRSGDDGRMDPVSMPVKIVAGNKCDLQESRQVSSKVGLEWARKRKCGFMETSARNTVNIEETFALIVRRVVEARKKAIEEIEGTSSPHGALGSRPNALHSLDPQQFGTGTRRAMTAPLSPLPAPEEKTPLKNRKKFSWAKLKCF